MHPSRNHLHGLQVFVSVNFRSNKKRVTIIGNAFRQRNFDKDKLREDEQTHAWQAQGRHPLVSPFKVKS
jgi:hypothetical protein